MLDPRGLWITRLLLQRGIGVISLVAFLVALHQFRPLLGARGLLPVPLFVKRVPFHASPSLFYLFPRDWAFAAAAWLGIILSCLVITGISERYNLWLSVGIWTALWVLYLSFVNVGQTFYGFGWESILLEGMFLAIFLGNSQTAPQQIPVWLFRWLLFRIMFGAGLIKLRGDSCWRDLTCLHYYYETQPMPNPLSWYFHWAPSWINKTGVAFNHFAELIVPFAYFLPQPIAGVAGVITIVFQSTIILSGNLSWLNWLTLILAFSTFDGKFLGLLSSVAIPVMHAPARAYQAMAYSAAALVVVLSIPVITNMLSRQQVMNTAFNSLHLVGSYGAFGTITRTRYEIVIEGTDSSLLTGNTRWQEYEFKGKPGDVQYRPPQIAPYHLRLDWLMWFAAMGDYRQNPWFVHFVWQLLEGDRATLSLLRVNPFPEKPPRYIRALLYEYHFTTPKEHRQNGAWWTRTAAGEYFPPVSLETEGLRRIIQAEDWYISPSP